MYQGKDLKDRFERISELDYPNFEIIEVREGHGWSKAVKDVPEPTEVCVFWIDDGKPVGNDFLQKLTQPITAPKESRAVMHFWSGNALSVSKSLVDQCPLEDEHIPTSSLLKLLLPVLDVAEKEPHGRVHFAFSSTERLAPLAMDPIGAVM